MCQLSTGLSVYQILSIEFERHVNRGLIYKKLLNWTFLSSILHILYTARLYCRVYFGAVYSGRSVSVCPAVSINHDRYRQSAYFLRGNFRSQKIVNLSDVVHCETTPPSLILYYKIPLLISYRLATAFVVRYFSAYDSVKDARILLLQASGVQGFTVQAPNRNCGLWGLHVTLHSCLTENKITWAL